MVSRVTWGSRRDHFFPESSSRGRRRTTTTVIARAKAVSSKELRALDAQNVQFVERMKPGDLKLAQAFYRRTGALFLAKAPLPVLKCTEDEEIARLFFPALLALVLEPVQALIDTSIVGRLGPSELGAVGLGTVVFQFALGTLGVFIFGTTPLVADHASSKNIEMASKVTSKGARVALLFGMVMQAVLMMASPHVMGAVSSDAHIASLASGYLEARCWGIPAALIMMVGIGAARGHKDMVSPFVGSALYGLFLGLFDVLFVYGLDMGVEGAGYAASISQWIGACTVLYMLHRKGQLMLEDLVDVPTVSDAMPYVKMAPSLALGQAAVFMPMLASSSIATSLGPNNLAAHTVLRQISSFWLQLFMAYNATAHSMVASSLSKRTAQGMGTAAEIMERICHLAVLTSIPLGIGLYALEGQIPFIFTDSLTVNKDVVGVLPLLLILMVCHHDSLLLHIGCTHPYHSISLLLTCVAS